jgi:hypothetical protein
MIYPNSEEWRLGKGSGNEGLGDSMAMKEKYEEINITPEDVKRCRFSFQN